MDKPEQPKAVRRNRRPEFRPWHPTPYEKADVAAIQALHRGEATPEQQRRALKWIVVDLCRTHDEPYAPESDRDTAYACGRRRVGLEIFKFLQSSLNQLFWDGEQKEQP